MLHMSSPRIVPPLAVLLFAIACTSSARTEPASPTPLRMTRTRPAAGAIRLQARAGGVIDFALSPGDTTLALRLGDRMDAQAAPRANVRFSREALQRFADDLHGLAESTMPADSSRYMWGVEIDDGRGDLAAQVTRVARRAGEAELRDSFALAARAVGTEPLVITLTPEEFGDVTGLVRSYAEYLALLPKEPPGPGGRPYFYFELDEPVTPSSAGCSLHYPESLRMRGVSGKVKARFIVGADGRVEPGSWEAVESTHPDFAREVHRASSCARYHPARVGGQPVRAFTDQPFTFDIAH